MQPHSTRPIVGLAGPLSGPLSAYGRALLRLQELDGAEAVRWMPVDDGADPVIARAAAAYLLAQGAVAVIGHFNSACALAVAPLYGQARVPLLAPATTHDDLAAQGAGWTLMYCGSNSGQARAILGFLRQRLIDARAVRVENDGSTYGADLHARLVHEGLVYHPPDPVSIVFAGKFHLAARFLHQQRALGWQGLFLATDDAFIKAYLQAVTSYGNSFVAGPVKPYEEVMQDAGVHLLGALREAPRGAQGVALLAALHAAPGAVHAMGANRDDACAWAVYEAMGGQFRKVLS